MQVQCGTDAQEAVQWTYLNLRAFLPLGAHQALDAIERDAVATPDADPALAVE